ncbi:MAG: hypothetical protein Satyrvirus25_14 [Satyrvirus sp.]|uniref:Ankyrin repeat protein n=1 Tax=Satyrvirus sp. TaxID=2487771 RepID=A0A3G5AJE5_9VIRU|nr:MAG: hypothetical protein Satyrvirus25_14 [Satyrvirus sp.]
MESQNTYHIPDVSIVGQFSKACRNQNLIDICAIFMSDKNNELKNTKCSMHLRYTYFKYSGDEYPNIYDIEFLYACTYGNVEVVKFLLVLDANEYMKKKGINYPSGIHGIYEEGLHLACINGHLSVIHAFTKLNNENIPKVILSSDRMFHCACQYRHHDIITYLYLGGYKQSYSNDIRIDYQNLIDSGSVQTVKFLAIINEEILLKVKAENNDEIKKLINSCRSKYEHLRNLVELAKKNNNGIIFKYIIIFYDHIVKNDYDDVFLYACKNGKKNIAKILLKFKKIPEKHVRCSKGFREACEANQIEMVQFLLKYYNLEEVCLYYSLETIFNETCKRGYVEIAKILAPLMGLKLHARSQYSGNLLYNDEITQVIVETNKKVKEIQKSFANACQDGKLQEIYDIKHENNLMISLGLVREQFIKACECGNNSVVELFVRCFKERLNITILKKGFIQACKGEYTSIVELLLFDNIKNETDNLFTCEMKKFLTEQIIKATKDNLPDNFLLDNLMK